VGSVLQNAGGSGFTNAVNTCVCVCVCVCVYVFGSVCQISLSHFFEFFELVMYVYIYIYIYMYVCVCVCRLRRSGGANMPTAGAVITGGGDLPSDRVIHVNSPSWCVCVCVRAHTHICMRIFLSHFIKKI